MTVNGDSILPYLLTWVIIYLFGRDTDFGNRSQFDPLYCLVILNLPITTVFQFRLSKCTQLLVSFNCVCIKVNWLSL